MYYLKDYSCEITGNHCARAHAQSGSYWATFYLTGKRGTAVLFVLLLHFLCSSSIVFIMLEWKFEIKRKCMARFLD